MAGIETIGVADGGTAGNEGGAGTETCTPHLVLTIPSTKSVPSPVCTAEENTTFLTCYADTDEDTTACAAEVAADCSACLLTAESSGTWGALINVPVPSVPAGMGLAVNVINVGACVLQSDTSAQGQACGNAVEALISCEVAACAPYCTFTSSSDTQAETMLLGSTTDPSGCVEEADTQACMTEETTASEDCLGNEAYTNCVDLRATIESSTATAAEISVAASDFLRLTCGGS